MAKSYFVESIKPGISAFDEIFSVKEVQQHTTKTGDPFYGLLLQDKTGIIKAKIWKDAIKLTGAESIAAGDVLQLDFDASEYQGELQLTIKRASKTTDYNIHDLVKTTTKNVDEMYQKTISLIESIKDNDIRPLLLKILQDPEIEKKLKYAAAAEKVHHDFVGGLLEHMLEMFTIGESILTLYPMANRSIVFAGILMHDIGKIDELALQDATIIRTIPGYLVGHIVIGIELFNKFLPPDFPEAKRRAVEHIILSHHREMEFGAVVKPATIEAIIVAMLDLTSSVVRQYQKELVEGKADAQGFGEYQKFLQLKVYHEVLQES